MEIPEIRFAMSGDVHIAYQVVGDGPVDVVWIPDWLSNIEIQWELPANARFLNRLASFSRLLLFDKRGSGLSDRTVDLDLFTLEVRLDDVRAVMDATGSREAIIFGTEAFPEIEYPRHVGIPFSDFESLPKTGIPSRNGPRILHQLGNRERPERLGGEDTHPDGVEPVVVLLEIYEHPDLPNT